MRWFRSHARWGSWLALSALALQLALAFGHIHLKDVLGPADEPGGLVIAALTSEPDAQRAAPPADRAPHQHEDEHCAIYAINSLLGASQIAAPPAVPLPSITCRARLATAHQSLLSERRHAGAQARAPPLA